MQFASKKYFVFSCYCNMIRTYYISPLYALSLTVCLFGFPQFRYLAAEIKRYRCVKVSAFVAFFRITKLNWGIQRNTLYVYSYGYISCIWLENNQTVTTAAALTIPRSFATFEILLIS